MSRLITVHHVIQPPTGDSEKGTSLASPSATYVRHAVIFRASVDSFSSASYLDRKPANFPQALKMGMDHKPIELVII